MGWWVAINLLIFLQCDPLSRMWDKSITTGHCLNSYQTFIGNAIPNIIIDILILLLPIHEVFLLHLSLAKRVSITGVFLLGGL